LLDEVRALKVIKADLARDDEFVQRFKNEAINTRELQHPNAVRVDDLDLAEDGRPFMSMELVEGESLSLKSLIVRSGPLGPAWVLETARQVAEALEAAHTLGLVHRDLKPDNIVLVPRPGSAPLVKILDFDIARLKEEASGAGQAGLTLTGTGVVIGTPDYMSPEQAMGRRGEDIDRRSDLYSLGIVMYRMLTGELPFKADTTVEMILHHIQTPPKPPQVLKPELYIPDAASTIVMKALEKNREQRFASAAAAPRPAAVPAAAASPLSPTPAPARGPAREAPVATPPRAMSPAPSVPPLVTPVAQKPSSMRAAVWGVLVLLLVIVCVAAFKRRHPAPMSTAASDTPTPAAAEPANTAPTSSENSAASAPTTSPATSSATSPANSNIALRTSTAPPEPQPSAAKAADSSPPAQRAHRAGRSTRTAERLNVAGQAQPAAAPAPQSGTGQPSGAPPTELGSTDSSSDSGAQPVLQHAPR
jgi:serine/threonine-protein kinase